MGKMMDTARYWKSLGVAVIPAGYKSKQPKVRWLPYTERMPTEDEINYWFATDLTNIAVITGWNNLCIIDFDDMQVFMDWFTWAAKTGGKAEEVALKARMHQSARGMHVFIICDKAENMKLPKIDVLAERKYAMLPPSIHPSGARYEIYRDALPMPVESLYDVLPKRLLDDAIAQKAKAQTFPAPTIPSESMTVDYDPWECAGKDPSVKHQGLVNEIKNHIPISTILSGFEPSGGNGRWMMRQCPFHDDKNPSFWLDTKNNICGCHAGCTPLPLDVIDLYARLNGIDNFHAIQELAKRLPSY